MLRLLRVFPVVLWSGGAFFIGAGFAYGDAGVFPLALMAGAIGSGVLLQGITAHAFNDIVDWASGTDSKTCGILSGGSRVIPLRIFAPAALKKIGAASAGAAFVVAFLLAGGGRPFVWILFAVGVWAAAAYTLPPFKLVYRPFFGEWLAAWPAYAALGSGSYYVATGQLSFSVAVAAGAHGLLVLGWLMQHHLADIEADLSARPVKLTTPAFIHVHFGRKWPPAVPVVYYALALITSVWSGLFISGVFLFPAAAAVVCAYVAAKTDMGDVTDLTSREVLTGIIIFTSSALTPLVYILT